MSTTPFHPLDSGLHEFSEVQFGRSDDLRLLIPNEDGWSAIMLTCSEMGFGPDHNSIFDSGQLYVLQNFGNVAVPIADSETEVGRAIQAKGLQDVIVCGHLACHTVEHFLTMEDKRGEWLQHGDTLREFTKAHYGSLDQQSKFNVAAQENVLLQIEKVVASLDLVEFDVRFHAWMTDGSKNRVFEFDPVKGQFLNSRSYSDSSC